MPHPLTRRRAIGALGALGAMGSGLGGGALAQDHAATAYPSKPIRLVVPFPAGGATDVLARHVAKGLQQSWGQPVVVDNKPGAGGILGTKTVIGSAPDGHTLLVHLASVLQQPHLRPSRPYSMADLAPITSLVRGQLTLAVQKDLGVNTLDEFIALVRKNPGKYSLANYGPGTTPHLQGLMFARQAGLEITPVAFQGGAPLLVALKGNHVSAGLLDVAALRSLGDAVRLVATSGRQRWPSLPDVPTFAEKGFHSLDAEGWIGLFAPAATPEAIQQKLNREVARILRTPELTSAIEAIDMVAVGNDLQAYRRQVQADDALYARIIQETGVRLD